VDELWRKIFGGVGLRVTSSLATSDFGDDSNFGVDKLQEFFEAAVFKCFGLEPLFFYRRELATRVVQLTT